MKDLILIESNTTGTGMLAIPTARRIGLRPVLVTSRPDRYRGLDQTASDVIRCDTNSLPALRDVLAEVERDAIAGITTTSEFYLLTAAELAKEFGLPGNPPAAVRTCRNKTLLRECLGPDPTGQLRYAVVADPDPAVVHDAVRQVGLPCVVKPADDTGSYLVRICHTVQEVQSHVREVLAVRENVRGQPTAGMALIESFVAGPEYSVEMFSTDDRRICIGITEKTVIGDPHCVESRHIFPAGLSPDARAEIVATVCHALDAAGVRGGATHTEVKHGPRGFVIIEINCRPAGGMIPELIRIALGVDLLERHLRWAAGQTVDLAETAASEVAGIQFFTADQEGVLDRVDGVEDASAVAGVRDVTVTGVPGAKTNPARSAYDRMGYVVASGASRAEVARTLDEASRRLTIAVRPARPEPTASVDFDSHDRRISADPHLVYAQMRSSCPVAWSNAWGGFWVASHHAEVAAAARSKSFRTGYRRPDGTFQGISIPPLGHTGRLVPLELDSPECLKYRRLVSAFYSPNAVKARLPEFRALASSCIDDVIEKGTCDLVDALTLRLPGIITMRDVGLPDSRWREMSSMIHRALLSAPDDLDGAREYAQLVCLDIIEELEKCRDSRGRNGLIGQLLRAEVDGAPVPDNDIVSMIYLLLLGMDPASTLTATALWYLARHPETRAKLAADRSAIPAATEEFLRWVSPIQGTSRTAAEDMSFGGRQVKAGDRVFLTWASANRDEAVFDNAGEVDISRDTGAHIAFGGGQHYCIGASIVRAMFGVMITEVLTRIPDYELADESSVRWFPDISFVYGVCRLPVAFRPGRRTVAAR